jgi:hypothetical protein
MKKSPSPVAHKSHFRAVNKASEPSGAFDDALRAIVRAPKASVDASIARERAGKIVRTLAKGPRR